MHYPPSCIFPSGAPDGIGVPDPVVPQGSERVVKGYTNRVNGPPYASLVQKERRIVSSDSRSLQLPLRTPARGFLGLPSVVTHTSRLSCGPKAGFLSHFGSYPHSVPHRHTRILDVCSLPFESLLRGRRRVVSRRPSGPKVQVRTDGDLDLKVVLIRLLDFWWHPRDHLEIRQGEIVQ